DSKTSPSPSTGEGRDEGEVAADTVSLHANIRSQNFFFLFLILYFILIYIAIAATSSGAIGYGRRRHPLLFSWVEKAYFCYLYVFYPSNIPPGCWTQSRERRPPTLLVDSLGLIIPCTSRHVPVHGHKPGLKQVVYGSFIIISLTLFAILML